MNQQIKDALKRDMEAEMLLASIRMRAEELRENKSEDFKWGFNAGYGLAQEANLELDRIYDLNKGAK